MSHFTRDVPVLMSRRLFTLSATITGCAALSLLSGVVYVGCSGAARPAHLPPPTGAQPTATTDDPTSPTAPSAPTTGTPQVDQLPTAPAEVSPLAVPVTMQGITVSEALGLDDPDLLAEVALTSSNPAEVRYTALRRLEQVDRARAAEVAYSLVDDASSLVSVNALAILVRSGDTRISLLDARSQRIAAALASQG